MVRLATIAVLLASFWAAPVWAKVCLESTVRDQGPFDPFCQVYRAVKVEFSDYVGPRPTITVKPRKIKVDTENQMTTTLLYEVWFDDSEAARAMISDEVGFSARAERFAGFLKGDLCRSSPGLDDWLDSGGVKIGVAIALGQGTAGTETPQVTREISINITTCEAN